MYAGKLTADGAIEKGYHTAYLAVAPFMRYGPHLPLTAGIIIAEALAEAISTRIDAFMLPVQPFAAFLGGDEKYSVFADSALLYEMLLDIAGNLSRQGFRRLVLHQGYRGLSILYALTRHINASGIIETVLVNPCDLAEARHGGILQGDGNIHACELQTSLMAYLRPDYVKADRIRDIDYVPDIPAHYLNFKPISAFCPDGVWGRPSLATAEKGRKIYDKAVELSTAYIDEAFAFMHKNGDYTGMS
jgi:creatinine amidohydrolase